MDTAFNCLVAESQDVCVIRSSNNSRKNDPLRNAKALKVIGVVRIKDTVKPRDSVRWMGLIRCLLKVDRVEGTSVIHGFVIRKRRGCGETGSQPCCGGNQGGTKIVVQWDHPCRGEVTPGIRRHVPRLMAQTRLQTISMIHFDLDRFPGLKAGARDVSRSTGRVVGLVSDEHGGAQGLGGYKAEHNRKDHLQR